MLHGKMFCIHRTRLSETRLMVVVLGSWAVGLTEIELGDLPMLVVYKNQALNIGVLGHGSDGPDAGHFMPKHTRHSTTA